MYFPVSLPMSMNLLRCFALTLCLVPLVISCSVAQAAQPANQAQAHQGKPEQKPTAKPVRKQTASKPAKAPSPSKAKAVRKPVSKVATQSLPKPNLDLSLPADMVKDLKPDVGRKVSRRKPLLPKMFTQKPESDDSPFQLNGRLISNEMQLQLRNDSRRDVEGAAIEFEFRQ